MAADVSALQAAWSQYPAGMTTIDKLTAINSLKAIGPAVDVQRSEIQKVMSAHGVLDKMQAYVANPAAATQPCLTATNYILAVVLYEAETLGELMLVTSDPANLNLVQQIAPDLLADPANGMTADILAQMMALITPGVPWWQAHGFAGPITVKDLIAAGNLF
ncbi:hypothetical protein [Bradyrhizobium lablabi]|uniref:hypothetical protein n=1 Tax=Bradyrhizobium lablabi TaxID=722472 RepID=UPI001BADC397|nr:hypothetical protein [Bradyrhizobium lablabi]MBR0693694.1 hypothetical protein [Bradyrhizobium lablabi]